MADKRIQDLTAATSVQLNDLFVLEQSGAAKSLTGQVLVNDLAAELDGHGGISDISYTPPTSPSLDGTLTIAMADETVYTVSVTNGRGISGITWSSSGTAGDGMTHTGTIAYNDGTTSSVQFQDGVKGDTGPQTYVWFKWAAQYPEADADMQNTTGPYIGIYSGISSTPPTTYTSYTWYQYKGDTGETGASIQSVVKTGTSGLVDTYTITLTNGADFNFTVTNAKSISSITQISGSHAAGSTDVYQITFNDGDTFNFSVYNGTNGSGSVTTVSGIQADGNGDVPQVLSGNGAPSSASGVENQIYVDLSTGAIYYCQGEIGGVITWISAGTITIDSALSTSSTNPVQNAVITAKVGTTALNTTATDLSGAVNEVLASIPSASSTTPLTDSGSGVVGTGTTWARSNHRHPLNVPSSGVPADLGTASNGSASTYARSDHVHALSSVLSAVYPVGSIYMSVNSTSPATLFGGTWTQIQDTFLLAAGSTYAAGATGGEATHTLSADEMPSHRHELGRISTYSSGGSLPAAIGYGSSASTGTYYTGYTGSGAAHNNMPPYLAVYVWQRTA